MIGCLGDIVFTVGDDAVLTPDDVKWSGSARYAEHQRHLGDALTEFTGLDPDKFSFDITLAAELGVDVLFELGRIWTYERKAVTLPLAIGEKFYGKYRWTIKKHSIKMKHFDGAGNLIVAVVSLDLLEYLTV